LGTIIAIAVDHLPHFPARDVQRLVPVFDHDEVRLF
jgi:hypothetical protein